MLEGKHYCITGKNLLAHELIGLRAEIAESLDKGRNAMKGKIIDETRNMIVLETRKGIKKIPKAGVKIAIHLGKERVVVDGNMLAERPENRVKKFWRKSHGRKGR